MQAHKDELGRINKYVIELQEKVKKECDNFSEDVKYWAEYKTGDRIKHSESEVNVPCLRYQGVHALVNSC